MVPIMEQPSTTPSIQSPRIQFRNPSLSGDRSTGVDGRRLSLANSTNEVFMDDDPTEDWTRTTAEKDSWANRERRRSSMWQKIDSYPSTKPPEGPSRSRERERRGSILSLFQHGKDKNGRDVLHSGEPPEGWDREPPMSPAIERSPSVEDVKFRPHHRGRRGSILSMFTWGKDKTGSDVIHSGFDHRE